MLARRILTSFAIATLLLASFAAPAAAHASKNSEDGKVRVTWGWQTEPMYAGEKVRIDLIIVDAVTRAGIGGLTADDVTQLSLRYGDAEYDLGNITANRAAKTGAFAGDGNYTGSKAIYLTKPGIYALHIEGTIAGSPIDLDIPAAHETPAIEDIAFPAEEDADDAALEARVAALETEVAALKAAARTQSQTPATLTPQAPANDAPAGGLLVAAIGLLGAALLLRRRA